MVTTDKPRRQVDANVGNTQDPRVQGTQVCVVQHTSRRFANSTTEYPNRQLGLKSSQLPADLVKKKFSHSSPLMTALYTLIALCLRSVFALLLGINRPVAQVIRAQAAMKYIAFAVFTGQTLTHPIHAPTL